MTGEADTPGGNTLETTNFRYVRRTMWQMVRSRYALALADAMSTVPDEQARRLAARAVRGDVRSFMSELLAHAPVPAIVRFLAVARQWGDSGELLLDQSDAVLGLADTVDPRPTWTAPEPLDREAAEDDARWSAWVLAWLAAFRATGPEAAAAVGEDAAKPTSEPAKENSTPRRWAPWLISAAAVIGTTAIVAVALKK